MGTPRHAGHRGSACVRHQEKPSRRRRVPRVISYSLSGNKDTVTLGGNSWQMVTF